METVQAAANRRPTKNEKRRQRNKNDKGERSSQVVSNKRDSSGFDEQKDVDDVVVEYVASDLDEETGVDKQALDQLKAIFEKFTRPEELLSNQPRSTEVAVSQAVADETKTEPDTELEAENRKVSKRKKKLLSRLSVAELKQLVHRPDVVEVHDVSSSNPRLLIHLKACRNTVPVPRHWCHIRKYLQGKRGIEKIPFQLPEFIAETGIAKIRESIMEQEALRKSKQKARERIRPKMGRIDIDYQVLHDAFFKHQTKPKMSTHGDLYFEGREFEVKMKETKPGQLSAELIAAVGMTDGAPPPWLINMQRFGPPPSYPNLRIPGLNAPLPPGAAYGYQPGGWGKPPVDEYGRPLYGDVFGTALTMDVDPSADIDKGYLWGALDPAQAEEEEEEEEDEEDEDAEEEEQRADAERQAAKAKRDAVSGMETPASLADQSWMSGFDAAGDQLDLRKRAGTETPESSAGPQRELYQVLKESKGSVSGQIFGSDRTYVVPGQDSSQQSSSSKPGSGQAASVTQNESLSRHLSGAAQNNDEDEATSGRKRKAEASLVSRKAKEFKF